MKKINKGSGSVILIIIIGIVGVIILGYYLFSTKAIPSLGDYMQNRTASSSAETNFIDITAPLGTIRTIVATSSEDQELGLGERDSLPDDEGMIFVFTDDASRSFWMQGMRFPLDIVWIRSDKTVAGIAPNVSIDSYPDIFVSPEPVMYVLELNAGAAQRYGVATGTPLTFVM